MTPEKKDKLRNLLIDLKAIASDQYESNDEDTFIGIYMCDLMDVIDDLER